MNVKGIQREIKAFVKEGKAKDLNKCINEPVEKVAYSSGIYGINGGILKGSKTGKMYAVTDRTGNLFRLF